MISALIRSKKPLPISVASPGPVPADSPPFTPTAVRYEDPPKRPRRSFAEASRDASALAGDANNSESGHDSDNQSGGDGDDDDDDEDEENAPLLPIFSSAHLDALPVYSITHSIRLLIVPRCETTISWEQLRSPQISQFLVKPILLQIRSTFFSRATLYALIANCYQFQKEGQAQPANVGVCRSRALIAELLAMRLLKEYSLRELIDALSYDFDPLAGMEAITHAEPRSQPFNAPAKGKVNSGAAIARISTLEVAIKAQAKRFLAHPVVVQHLEAIWAGTIVFHSAADNLHRYPTRPRTNHSRHYGATHIRGDEYEFASGRKKKADSGLLASGDPIRRSASLYDPSNASMFKLSRLRVPRYRQAFSTCSYAIMLGLFIALLKEREPNISALEVVFWFWMGGYMLDEIVGFSEQGFGLYIMSVWNAFDIGILILFGTYFVLRLYSVAIVEDQRVQVAYMAYDILGSSAILLFPRLFAVLDHVRYFSQLLIAFRLMAQDLVAILVLITITCSGFFVAFALSFPKSEGNWSQVIYILFQILMGFTPAAWDNWSKYNVLGRLILGLFLVICHFLVVTILVTVLTNSFMTIVKNANEEHQFLFAVNTISSVKSEALFSYIAPSNLFGWMIIPLRRILPFRKYVRLNRTVIKITHFPILLSIFVYERLRLVRYANDPADLVEKRGRQVRTAPLFSQNKGHEFEATSIRVREPSVSTYHKDRALEEVFRRPFQGDSTIIKPKPIGHQRSHVVSSWMNTVNEEGASTPEEQPKSILEQLEGHRPRLRRKSNSYGYDSRRRHRLYPRSVASRSVFSNPDEPRLTHTPDFRPLEEPEESGPSDLSVDGGAKETSAEGGDELVEEEAEGQDEDNDNAQATNRGSTAYSKKEKRAPFFLGPAEPAKEKVSEVSAHSVSPSPPSRGHRRDRNASTNTIIFKPEILTPPARKKKSSIGSKNYNEPYHTNSQQMTTQAFLPSRKPLLYSHDNRSSPILVPLTRGKLTNPQDPHALDSMSLDLVSDLGFTRRSRIDEELAVMPNSLIVGSFQTQMQLAADRAAALRKQAAEDDNHSRMSRLVLARMNTLEEGFKDILKEVKEIRSATAASSNSRGNGGLEKGLSRSISITKASRGHRKNGVPAVPARRRSSTVVDVGLLSKSHPNRRQQMGQTKSSGGYYSTE